MQVAVTTAVLEGIEDTTVTVRKQPVVLVDIELEDKPDVEVVMDKRVLAVISEAADKRVLA